MRVTKNILVPQAGIINYKQVSSEIAEILEIGVIIKFNKPVMKIISGQNVIVKTKSQMYETKK